MHTYSCSGTLGDVYITLCILYHTAIKGSVTCKHYTTVKHWYKQIRQIYSLLPNIQVDFVDQREMLYPRIYSTFACQARLGDTLFNHDEWCIFPTFPFSAYKRTLPDNYIVLSPKSGKPQEHRDMPIRTIKSIVDTSSQPIVVIGSKDQHIDIAEKNIINLVGKTSLLEAMSIVSSASRFVGFQGLMAFVAMSHRVHSKIYTRHEGDVRSIVTRTSDRWMPYCDVVTER